MFCSHYFTPLHIACQESGGREDRARIIRKLAEISDGYRLYKSSGDLFQLAVAAQNWPELKLLIELRLILDHVLEEVDFWPEQLFYQLATPLASFLGSCGEMGTPPPPEVTLDVVKSFVAGGARVDFDGYFNLPPICCRGNTTETIRTLIDNGAAVPIDAHFLFVAHKNSPATVCGLMRRGVFHPEFILKGVEKMGTILSTAPTLDLSKAVAAGILALAAILATTLGSFANVEALREVVQKNCSHLSVVNSFNNVFDEIRGSVTSSPSSLKLLCRAPVRRQLLAKRRHSVDLTSVIDGSLSTSLPIELCRFILFSDLDLSQILKWLENFSG